jgi:hypothetical protein
MEIIVNLAAPLTVLQIHEAHGFLATTLPFSHT